MSTTKAPAGAGVGKRNRSGCCRFFWGGFGALAPMALSLAILDHSALADYLANIEQKTFELAGFGFRIAALFGLGGLWAYFHRAEFEPLKLFQLGIVAPAMITGLINAGRVAETQAQEVAWLELPFALVSSAYAQDAPPPPSEPSGFDQFIDGVLGR